jgi:ribA/ribD-fused uncharacterized protein
LSDPIEFMSVRGAYGEFSNFARFPVEIDGRTWPTTEHYFQAQKFAGAADDEEIRLAPSATVAARMGRSRRRPLRRDWEAVKLDVMRTALRAKFTQHADLCRLLLGTGDRLIIERRDKDSYWGDGADRRGRNMLGVLLVELRDALRDEA